MKHEDLNEHFDVWWTDLDEKILRIVSRQGTDLRVDIRMKRLGKKSLWVELRVPIQ